MCYVDRVKCLIDSMKVSIYYGYLQMIVESFDRLIFPATLFQHQMYDRYSESGKDCSNQICDCQADASTASAWQSRMRS